MNNWELRPVSETLFLAFPSQAVLRITERDGVTTEDALRRLQSQWSNSKQVEHANVVLSTLWEPEVTRKQVRHSLAALHEKEKVVCLVVIFYGFVL